MRRAARRDAIASRPSKRGLGPRLRHPRAVRLVRRSEYDAVYRGGRRRSSQQFIVFCRANGLTRSRFGISVKKELGGAVVRNRIKRRVREILRLNRLEIPPGWDFVIHPRSGVVRAEFAPLRAELVRLLQDCAP